MIEAEGLADLLGDEEATSADYQNVKALNWRNRHFHGLQKPCNWHRPEGGLPKTRISTTFFFDRDAVGSAGIDMKTTVDYIPERVSHLCTGMLKAGACVRDGDGVVKVNFDAAV